MNENMKKFLEAVSSNAELVEKMKLASKEELIAMAGELGIELTAADLIVPEAQTLNDDELDAIAGGGVCGCFMGGGGTKGGKDGVCACVLGGTGVDAGEAMRCLCAVGGSGASLN